MGTYHAYGNGNPAPVKAPIHGQELRPKTPHMPLESLQPRAGTGQLPNAVLGVQLPRTGSRDHQKTPAIPQYLSSSITQARWLIDRPHEGVRVEQVTAHAPSQAFSSSSGRSSKNVSGN